MSTQHPQKTRGVSRRKFLQAGLAAGVTLSAWPLSTPSPLWGAEAGQPKRGGILRIRGWDPPHFDSHLTINNYTNYLSSFAYGRLVRHKTGADVQPGTFPIEPELAERWEEPDDTTVVFHLRQGVKWHNKPPVNGREFVAEDVKFTYDRFLINLVFGMTTGSWQPYVTNYAVNQTFDFGSRAAALWLDR